MVAVTASTDIHCLQCEKLNAQTGMAWVLVAAVEAPAAGSRSNTELVHFTCGTPALLDMLVQSNGELCIPTLTAACHDIDGGSAVAA